MRHARWADLNARIAGVVPGFSLFSKMTNPRKRRPLSACSLREKVRTCVVEFHRAGRIPPFHPLGFEPRQTFDTLSRDGDYTIAGTGVIREQVIVILRDCQVPPSGSMNGVRPMYPQESFSQISTMTSGAPFTYTSIVLLLSRFTMTLIRRKEDTNSKVRITPSSRKYAC